MESKTLTIFVKEENWRMEVAERARRQLEVLDKSEKLRLEALGSRLKELERACGAVAAAMVAGNSVDEDTMEENILEKFPVWERDMVKEMVDMQHGMGWWSMSVHGSSQDGTVYIL